MSYSYPWNNAVPAGTDLAAQLDTFITDMKNALTERFEDALIQSMTADPWVVKPEILGNVDGKELLLHWSAFTWDTLPAGAKTSTEIKTDTGAAATYTGRAAIPIPVGCILQEVRIMWEGNSSTNSTCKVYGVDYSTTPVANQIGTTMSRSGGTIAENSITALNEEILTDVLYEIEVALVRAPGGAAGLVGIKVIYDTPDCRNTR